MTLQELDVLDELLVKYSFQKLKNIPKEYWNRRRYRQMFVDRNMDEYEIIKFFSKLTEPELTNVVLRDGYIYSFKDGELSRVSLLDDLIRVYITRILPAALTSGNN